MQRNVDSRLDLFEIGMGLCFLYEIPQKSLPPLKKESLNECPNERGFGDNFQMRVTHL
jgi:hypothetical protein